MASLLTAIAGQRAGRDYVRRLAAACLDDRATARTLTPVQPAARGGRDSWTGSANASWMSCDCWPPTWPDPTSHVGSSCR